MKPFIFPYTKPLFAIVMHKAQGCSDDGYHIVWGLTAPDAESYAKTKMEREPAFIPLKYYCLRPVRPSHRMISAYLRDEYNRYEEHILTNICLKLAEAKTKLNLPAGLGFCGEKSETKNGHYCNRKEACYAGIIVTNRKKIVRTLVDANVLQYETPELYTDNTDLGLRLPAASTDKVYILKLDSGYSSSDGAILKLHDPAIQDESIDLGSITAMFELLEDCSLTTLLDYCAKIKKKHNKTEAQKAAEGTERLQNYRKEREATAIALCEKLLKAEKD